MSLTLESWLRRHRKVATVPDTLAEATPLRSPAAAYIGSSSGSPQADRAGTSLVRWLGESLAGRHDDEGRDSE